MLEHTSPGVPGLVCSNIVFGGLFGNVSAFFGFLLVFIGFTMVLARFFTEIIVFSFVFFGFSLVFCGISLVSFGFSLDLLVFITRVLGFILAILGSPLVLDWFYNGFGKVVLLPATMNPLWPTLERMAGAPQKCPRRSGAP